MSQTFRKNEYFKDLLIKFGNNTRNLFTLWIIRIISFFFLIIGAILPNSVARVILYLISMIILWAIGPLLIEYITEPIENYRLVNTFLIIYNGTGILTAFGVIIINGLSPNSPIAVIFLWSFIFWLELSFEEQAWEEFEKFIRNNEQLFPIAISEDFIIGIKKIKQAVFIMIFSFLLLPLIIGLILLRLGYTKINDVMKKFIQMDKSLPYQKAKYEITHPQTPKFCSNCRTPIQEEETHCVNCGVEILTTQ